MGIVDEIPSTMLPDRRSQLLLDLCGISAISLGDPFGLVRIVGIQKWVVLRVAVRSRLHRLEETGTNDDLALPFGFQALARFDGEIHKKRRAKVHDGHQKHGEREPDAGPTARFPRGTILEQFLLPLAAACCPFPRGTEQQAEGTPKTRRTDGFRDHDCGGRAVSFRKMSSRLASPKLERNSSREPLATTVPSLMMTACEQSRVTWSIRCVENRTVVPCAAFSEMRS